MRVTNGNCSKKRSCPFSAWMESLGEKDWRLGVPS